MKTNHLVHYHSLQQFKMAITSSRSTLPLHVATRPPPGASTSTQPTESTENNGKDSSPPASTITCTQSTIQLSSTTNLKTGTIPATALKDLIWSADSYQAGITQPKTTRSRCGMSVQFWCPQMEEPVRTTARGNKGPVCMHRIMKVMTVNLRLFQIHKRWMNRDVYKHGGIRYVRVLDQLEKPHLLTPAQTLSNQPDSLTGLSTHYLFKTHQSSSNQSTTQDMVMILKP